MSKVSMIKAGGKVTKSALLETILADEAITDVAVIGFHDDGEVGTAWTSVELSKIALGILILQEAILNESRDEDYWT